MENNRRKELLHAYKFRKPEMGILSFVWKESGESFFCLSKDLKATRNSTTFQLMSGNHPNERMQALWQQHGKDGLEISTLRTHKYDDPQEDQTEALTLLLEECLEQNPEAKRVWK